METKRNDFNTDKSINQEKHSHALYLLSFSVCRDVIVYTVLNLLPTKSDYVYM